MEVFQKLKIFITKDLEQEFVSKLITSIKHAGWIHKSDFEDSYKKNTSVEDDKVLCFETNDLDYNNKIINGYIWLWKKNNYFEVFNIIPTKPGSLSYNQYNYILNYFFISFISDLVSEMNLKTEFSQPNKSISEIIGKDASESLIRFSKSANKSTGNSNPYDFNRWCEFIFILHRKKIELNIDDFVRWLKEEEDWSDEIAWKLGIDLEYALDILEKYEQN